MSREVTNNIRNWIIEDGFAPIEEETIRISKEVISSFNKETEEFDIIAVPYDGAPDKWGKYGEDKDTTPPSGHDWTGREGEFFEWSWKITDGWSENDALGLPGLYGYRYSRDDYRWRANNIECKSCHIYVNKSLDECEHCGNDMKVTVNK